MDIGLPKINIVFKGLGTSAIQRGQNGVAVLIVKDDTSIDTFFEYRGIDEFTSEEQAKFTTDNLQYIKDCLEGIPAKLIVVRMDTTETSLADTLAKLKARVPMNCWIGIAEGTAEEQGELASFVSSAVKNDYKRYKAIVYNSAADNMHVVNFTNISVVFVDERAEQTGDKAISYLLGYLAGLPLTMSAIAKKLPKFTSVIEPSDLDTSIANGEFVLYNDEGSVKASRGVNSLTTTSEGITDDMKFIHVVEIMDIIYTDIYKTWNDSYKGRYPNSLDNEILLISGINGYFEELEKDSILDSNFDNKCLVDIQSQRVANYAKYTKEIVDKWDDNTVMAYTVGTNVYLTGKIKILGIMEDIDFTILM